MPEPVLRGATYDDASFFDIVPEWICEVVSPHTSGLDRLRKLPRYASNGVRYAWIVDPSTRGLEIDRLEGEHFALIGGFEGSGKVRAEPFDAFELDLSVLWIP